MERSDQIIAVGDNSGANVWTPWGVVPRNGDREARDGASVRSTVRHRQIGFDLMPAQPTLPLR